ncbi:MAG TPA: 4-hydroxybenzoate octaprenyltransferase, partial [Rhodoferax sp.]|nr:4-hydroxybenzoate octaprenyltransferase [Rhodoferax sp.]
IKTSAITLGMWDVPVIMLFYLVFLGIWTLALTDYVPGVPFYIGIAVALAQVAWHFTLIRTRTRDGCFKAFRLNHWLGFAVFAGIAASYAGR